MNFYQTFVHFSSDSDKTWHIVHKNVFNDSEFVNIGAVTAMVCLKASYFVGEIGCTMSEQTTLIQFNPLQPKRRPLYLKPQSVPL
jgi:hypothetical protein